MILPVINQTVGFHFAECGRNGRAVYFQIVSEPLAVEGNVEFSVWSFVRNKAHLLRDDFCEGFGDCLLACPAGVQHMPHAHGGHVGGCLGSAMHTFNRNNQHAHRAEKVFRITTFIQRHSEDRNVFLLTATPYFCTEFAQTKFEYAVKQSGDRVKH